MEQYKIVFKLNGSWCFSVFCYRSEQEKAEKLQRWKDENVNPYDKIEVIWHGIPEEYSYGIYQEINQQNDENLIN